MHYPNYDIKLSNECFGPLLSMRMAYLPKLPNHNGGINLPITPPPDFLHGKWHDVLGSKFSIFIMMPLRNKLWIPCLQTVIRMDLFGTTNWTPSAIISATDP